ncbi:uncharacterized protein LY89DRAFT_197357 [Mollisia scopiformis]|uniref:Uncharacterized protein n=1 Tax=Mollisia scopiformis TaxID=149040 RepID=A0A194WZ19_MOLSC|nr:uncharacterized protein LY89DRAFT_197357 [Mollisia scopiformis]KUJ12944.1 hypothetical protein LY89DRAFT_197357 [Mollisia scopiformis]
MAMIKCFLSKGWGCSFNSGDLSVSFLESSAIRGMIFKYADFEKCKLTGVRLIGCEITDSELDGCDLTDCMIKKSASKDSKMSRCTISENVDAINTTFTKCIVNNANMQRCKFQTSVCFESTATDTNMDSCRADTVVVKTSRNVTYTNSELRFCSIDGGFVTHSSLSDCELERQSGLFFRIKDCQVISHPLALRKFIPEIRDLIFEYALAGNGKDSSLIAALRGEPKLYHEALEVLRKTCVFRLIDDFHYYYKAIPYWEVATTRSPPERLWSPHAILMDTTYEYYNAWQHIQHISVRQVQPTSYDRVLQASD